MSIHFYDVWSINDPITEDIMRQLCAVIRDNPACFAVLNEGDLFANNTRNFLRYQKDFPTTEKALDGWFALLSEADREIGIQYRKQMEVVLKHLEEWK